MRVNEDRYWRDLRRLDLAVRMLHLEARVGTICTWTSLRPDRVKTLARSLEPPGAHEPRSPRGSPTNAAANGATTRTARAAPSLASARTPARLRDAQSAFPTRPIPPTDPPPIIRHRGQSPRQLAYFSRSIRVRLDAAALASFLVQFEVIPKDPLPDAARRAPTVPRGLALCEAYQAYRVLIPTSQLTFEYAALLTVGLAAAEELQLAICPHCGVLLVIDPLATHRDQCLYCNPSISATLDDLCPPHATRTTPSFWRRRSAIRRAPDDPTSPEALHHNGVRHAARTG